MDAANTTGPVQSWSVTGSARPPPSWRSCAPRRGRRTRRGRGSRCRRASSIRCLNTRPPSLSPRRSAVGPARARRCARVWSITDRVLEPDGVERLQCLAMRDAGGRFHSECSSTMMSILSPTALRIFSNGSSAFSRSAAEMYAPLQLGRDVEGPDLHAGDALGEQRAASSSAIQKRVEVLVGWYLPASATQVGSACRLGRTYS